MAMAQPSTFYWRAGALLGKPKIVPYAANFDPGATAFGLGAFGAHALSKHVKLGHSGSIPADARCGIARHLVNPTKRPTRQSVRGPADTRGDDHILRVDLSAHRAVQVLGPDDAIGRDGRAGGMGGAVVVTGGALYILCFDVFCLASEFG
ncbi:LOW QUALITY PROTEIN: hypothetical protein BC938DRAFT_478350 [Jimgerdemannia flammicorona]|uniref:Uncharacterized protein n=1 Tax=Jimgerdemannia flammicorona TaxID=994334 RepID=A0A433QYI2_9FUNG|nr:LOW QUALITY PROTEIN: hypothetical protein BC938DRAFT_478350 [Jimgerdemannia flammicorona]